MLKWSFFLFWSLRYNVNYFDILISEVKQFQNSGRKYEEDNNFSRIKKSIAELQ